VYLSPRDVTKSLATKQLLSDANEPVVYLPDSGQIARLLSTAQVPQSVIPQGLMSSDSLMSYNSLIDILQAECIT